MGDHLGTPVAADMGSRFPCCSRRVNRVESGPPHGTCLRSTKEDWIQALQPTKKLNDKIWRTSIYQSPFKHQRQRFFTKKFFLFGILISNKTLACQSTCKVSKASLLFEIRNRERHPIMRVGHLKRVLELFPQLRYSSFQCFFSEKVFTIIIGMTKPLD